MPIVGFTFTTIRAEKRADIREKVNISNNITITHAEESQLPFGQQKQDGLKISFQFISSYEPNIGAIELNGNLLYIGDAKQLKDVVKNWNKDKKLPTDIMKHVLHAVMNKCNIQALVMSRDVGLPPPVPLPQVNVK